MEWFWEKLRLILTFEGDAADAEYLLDEWPEGLLARAANTTIPVFVVTAMAARPRHQKALDVVSAVPSLDFGTQTALSCRSALASPRDAHRINLFHNF